MTISDQNVLKILMQSRGRIQAAAWVVVCDTQIAEDIFQNVILKVMTKKEITFQAEEALLSWAFITARREGIDWLRQHGKESVGLDSKVLELLEQEWLSETPNYGEERLDALRGCIENLSEESSQLLRSRYFENNSCGEVAKQVGIRLNTVYKRLSRLHQDLKACIEIRLNELKGS